MTDNGSGRDTKRFSGDGNDGAAAYKVWKRWAKAAIAVQTASEESSGRGDWPMAVHVAGRPGSAGDGAREYRGDQG